jgi:hypothetical protein
VSGPARKMAGAGTGGRRSLRRTGASRWGRRRPRGGRDRAQVRRRGRAAAAAVLGSQAERRQEPAHGVGLGHRVKGQDFEIVLWPGTLGRAKPGSTACTIEVEDCRKAFDALKSRGVKFEPSDVLEFPWGYAARFQDPDGNQLQMREGRRAFPR